MRINTFLPLSLCAIAGCRCSASVACVVRPNFLTEKSFSQWARHNCVVKLLFMLCTSMASRKCAQQLNSSTLRDTEMLILFSIATLSTLSHFYLSVHCVRVDLVNELPDYDDASMRTANNENRGT